MEQILEENLTFSQVIRMFIEEFGEQLWLIIKESARKYYKSLFSLRNLRFNYHSFCDQMFEWVKLI